ncbi:MAG: hypothetical protein JRH11_20085 [Deltaproteobacteria bacterium]|nr:hypothetical protein [Deltaproteobacteria bacterium]
MIDEPTRALVDPQASEALRDLLGIAPAPPTLDPGLKAEIGSRLTDSLAAAGAGGVAGTSLLSKLLSTNLLPILGVGLIVAAGVAAYMTSADEPEATSSLGSAEAVMEIAELTEEHQDLLPVAAPSGPQENLEENPEELPEDESSPIPEPAAVDPEPPSPANPAAGPPPPAPPPTETELIDEARSLLRTTPRAALRKLSAHERRFPAGQLVGERELLALEALDALGEHEARRTRAQRFIANYPRSPYRRVAEEILAPPWAAPEQ